MRFVAWVIAGVVGIGACGEDKCRVGQETEPGVCHVPGRPDAGQGGRADGGASSGLAGLLDATIGESEPLIGGGDEAGGGADVGSGGAGGRVGELRGHAGAAGGIAGGGGQGGDHVPADAGCGGGCAPAVEAIAGGGGGGSSVPEPRCGDGIVSGDELCELTGEYTCPSVESCRASMCRAVRYTGDVSTCDAHCEVVVITVAQSGDGCCPDGASAGNDADCPCGGDSDCDEGQYCAGTRCYRRTCKTDDNCTDDRWCSSVGQCELRRAGLCTRDRNCPVGNTCKAQPGGYSECG